MIRALAKFGINAFHEILAVCLDLLPDDKIGNSIRGGYWRLRFRKVGKRLHVSRGVRILYPGRVDVGHDVYIGYKNWINAFGGLDLGDEVMTGPFVCISTANHTKVDMSYRFGEHLVSPVSIGRGTWLAAHVCVMPGATISDGALIAAGAVVTKGVLPTGVYGGVPAKIVRAEGM